LAECCVLEELANSRPRSTDTENALTARLESLAPASDAATEPQEVAPGVFFLKGGTRYFREGTVTGPAGAVRSLMCNNGWVVLDDAVLLVDANMPGRADDLLAAARSTTSKPGDRVIFTGDLVTNGAFNIVRDSEMAPWVDTLTAMQTLAPSIVCPGHGSLGNSTTVDNQRAFFVPPEADLPVLSLRAQVERTYDQLRGS
jgi:hypothetical protein